MASTLEGSAAAPSAHGADTLEGIIKLDLNFDGLTGLLRQLLARVSAVDSKIGDLEDVNAAHSERLEQTDRDREAIAALRSELVSQQEVLDKQSQLVHALETQVAEEKKQRLAQDKTIAKLQAEVSGLARDVKGLKDEVVALSERPTSQVTPAGGSRSVEDDEIYIRLSERFDPVLPRLSTVEAALRNHEISGEPAVAKPVEEALPVSLTVSTSQEQAWKDSIASLNHKLASVQRDMSDLKEVVSALSSALSSANIARAAAAVPKDRMPSGGAEVAKSPSVSSIDRIAQPDHRQSVGRDGGAEQLEKRLGQLTAQFKEAQETASHVHKVVIPGLRQAIEGLQAALATRVEATTSAADYSADIAKLAAELAEESAKCDLLEKKLDAVAGGKGKLATEQYCDLRISHVVKQVEGVRTGLHDKITSELQVFEEDLQDYLTDQFSALRLPHAGDLGPKGAAGRQHFRCLTCDNVVQTLRGPATEAQRIATLTLPQPVDKHPDPMVIGDVICEPGKEIDLYNKSGEVYRGRTEPTMRLLRPASAWSKTSPTHRGEEKRPKELAFLPVAVASSVQTGSRPKTAPGFRRNRPASAAARGSEAKQVQLARPPPGQF